MKRLKPPFRAIVPGKVFRQETDRRQPRAHLPPDGGPGDRQGHLRRPPDQHAMKTLLARRVRPRDRGPPAAGLLPVRRARLRARRALPVLQGGLQRLQAIHVDRAAPLRHGAPQRAAEGGIDPELGRLRVRARALAPGDAALTASTTCAGSWPATCASWSSSRSPCLFPTAGSPGTSTSPASTPQQLARGPDALDRRGRGPLRFAPACPTSPWARGNAIKHPDADQLSVCKVDVGAGGAAADRVRRAERRAGHRRRRPPGTTLPGDLKIKKSKIRGQESNGMICSERELGLGEEHDGIWVLPQRRSRRRASPRRSTWRLGDRDRQQVGHAPPGPVGAPRDRRASSRRSTRAPLKPLDTSLPRPAPGPRSRCKIESRRLPALSGARLRRRAPTAAARLAAHCCSRSASADRPAGRPVELRDARSRPAQPPVRPPAARRRRHRRAQGARGRTHADARRRRAQARSRPTC
jgi:tRNA-binding EMAP/Myf-like protein